MDRRGTPFGLRYATWLAFVLWAGTASAMIAIHGFLGGWKSPAGPAESAYAILVPLCAVTLFLVLALLGRLPRIANSALWRWSRPSHVREWVWIVIALLTGSGIGVYGGSLAYFKLWGAKVAPLSTIFLMLPAAVLTLTTGTTIRRGLLRLTALVLPFELYLQVAYGLRRGGLAYWDDITAFSIGFLIGGSIYVLLQDRISRMQPSLRQRLFAKFMASEDEKSHEMYRARKEQLLRPLRGTVVELGPGTGVNLGFFDADEVEWVGLEPNPAMHSHIVAKAYELDLSADIIPTTLAESGLEPGSIDAVVSTLVLCSVPDLEQLLVEIRDVLKPRGVFVFIEHVVDRPGTVRRIVQKTAPFTPWDYFSDGCDPGRDIGAAIRNAGFEHVDLTEYMQPGSGPISAVTRPHIAGIAVK